MKQTLKDIFKDDPETLEVLELREQTGLLRSIADKKISFDGIETIKGDKGEKGDVGEKGEQGEKGEDGLDGKDGLDGRDGIDGKNGVNGVDAISYSKQDMISLISELLQEMEAKDFGAVSEKEVRDILKKHSTATTNKLAQDLANLRGDVVRNYGGHGGNGGGTTINSIFNEVVAGSGNTFTLAHTPTANTQVVYALGQRLTPTVDYTIAGAIISTISSWNSGEVVCDYQY